MNEGQTYEPKEFKVRSQQDVNLSFAVFLRNVAKDLLEGNADLLEESVDWKTAAEYDLAYRQRLHNPDNAFVTQKTVTFKLRYPGQG